jgi:hypothetical protein
VKDYNKNCTYDDAPDSLYEAVQLIQPERSLKFMIEACCFEASAKKICIESLVKQKGSYLQ